MHPSRRYAADQEVKIDWLAANTGYEFWFSSVSPVGPGEYAAIHLYTLSERTQTDLKYSTKHTFISVPSNTFPVSASRLTLIAVIQ